MYMDEKGFLECDGRDKEEKNARNTSRYGVVDEAQTVTISFETKSS